ncbi:MAG: SsrA-binding protein SmpB [Oscillospiraceae bacterium]|nr:SsrA-binding protein SmpB [Oscillospiraceae bacterium]
MEKTGTKVIAANRKARHDYFVEDTFECGIALAGTEVKSLRAGTVNLKDSYCIIKDGELFVISMHISPYEKGNIFNRDPMRQRKLLMHRREINRLFGLVKQDGYSLIPLSLYFKGSRVKLEMGLCKGKKLHDKRESTARRDADREMDRTLKERNR